MKGSIDEKRPEANLSEDSNKTLHKLSSKPKNLEAISASPPVCRRLLVTVICAAATLAQCLHLQSVDCGPILETNTLPSNLSPWIPIKDYRSNLLLAPRPQQETLKASESHVVNVIGSGGAGELIPQLLMHQQQHHPTAIHLNQHQAPRPMTTTTAAPIVSTAAPTARQQQSQAEPERTPSCVGSSAQVRGKCEALRREGGRIADDFELMRGEASMMSARRNQMMPNDQQSAPDFPSSFERPPPHPRGDSYDQEPRSGQEANGEHPDERDDNDDDGPSSPLDSSESAARGNSRAALPRPPQAGYEAEPDEAAERSEQEAAEASEADAANKSALDEQQQAQRQIILQQAQSEAKAIKEQQEALMQQQRLQQQMLLRRQHELANDDPKLRGANRRQSAQRDRQQQQQRQHQQQYHRAQQLKMAASKDLRLPAVAVSGGNGNVNQDIQFSDQLTGYPSLNVNEESNGEHHQNPELRMGNSAIESADAGDRDSEQQSPGDQENPGNPRAGRQSASVGGDDDNTYGQLGDSSNRQNSISPGSGHTKVNLAATNDLLPAAQHHYGAHYGSLHGHHKDYYQFAESHKKGQFDSGFKRGGKKFHISGHSSQHKGHAEGHVKWKGKKGKGSQYWDFKHKKGYGGGGHHHYY